MIKRDCLCKLYDEVLEKAVMITKKSFVITAFSLLLYSISMIRVKFLLSQK